MQASGKKLYKLGPKLGLARAKTIQAKAKNHLSYGQKAFELGPSIFKLRPNNI